MDARPTLHCAACSELRVMDVGAVLPVVKKMALCITAIPAMEKVANAHATAARGHGR